jgi:hypothetical protein
VNQKTNTRLKCPYCGGEYKAEIELIPAISETEQYIFKQIMRFTCGVEPHKGYIKRTDKIHTYKFYLQIYDSPEGDTWVRGTAEWVPRSWFKMLEMEYLE